MAYNYFNMTQPGRPDYFNPLYNPDGTPKAGTEMGPEIQAMLDKIELDSRGMDKYRSEALRSGPSAWAKLATGAQRGEEAAARDAAAQTAASATAGAKSNLAQRGGLTSGAAERLEAGGARNYLDMNSAIGRAGNQNRLQIGINDEQNRMTQLGALPGMELAQLEPEFQKTQLMGQANQFDLTNTAKNAEAQNAFDMNAYTEQMKAWAANKQADATANSGKKGFLGLGK